MTKDQAETLFFGEVVCLTSGGPFMSVFRLGDIHESGERMVTVVWFGKYDHSNVKQMSFSSDLLTPCGGRMSNNPEIVPG